MLNMKKALVRMVWGQNRFKCFWKQLGPFVVRVLNKAFEDDELPTTQKGKNYYLHSQGRENLEITLNTGDQSLSLTLYTKLDLTVLLTDLKEYYHHK